MESISGRKLVGLGAQSKRFFACLKCWDGIAAPVPINPADMHSRKTTFGPGRYLGIAAALRNEMCLRNCSS
jgi:hypothetical protein